MPGSANLNIMLKTARLAGRSLSKDFREVENLQVSRKGVGDFVSRADIAAENIIRNELMEARPTYGWVGEESDAEEGKDPTRRWIVDPLDGTTNFLHGLPHWAVSIALEHKGEIISGVIYDPSKDEMFFAEKGLGAWMNESRIRVSARYSIADSLYGVRRYGAAALDLAYVAAGRYEGYWERNLNNWDIAAGVIIAREAGAIVESISGNTDPLIDGSIIAVTEVQFDKLAKIIRQ